MANLTLRGLRKFWRRDDGTAAVEFALVGVLFFITLLTFVEVGRIFWTWNSLQHSVSKAARYYLTHKTLTDQEIEELVEDNLAAMRLDVTHLEVTVDDDTASGINFIVIDAVYTFELLGYFLPSGVTSIDLTTTTRLPIDSSAS